DVGRRHRDVFREAAVAVDANDFRVRAHVRVARAAQQATAVDDVALRRNAITFPHVGHERADVHDFTSELMTNDEWRRASSACPRVPFIDVNVGAAYTGATHVNQYFILTHRRLRDVLQCEPPPSGSS